ncbi:MAG: c-type cytochrome biogenesis protein CcsB [Candidatus Melainabacteria bacterium]|nr:c-type cytochrome biogenesis protein CcsB [Candidatus Melainabacteria bacterium]
MLTAELTISNAAGISSIIALWMFVISSVFSRARIVISRLALATLTLSFLCVSAAIIVRAVDAARFPIANLYESLLLFAWGILASYLVLNYVYKLPELGWLAALTVSSVFLCASWLPASQHEISPLMPALVSNWRTIHVPPLIVSYALLLIAGLVAIVHLWTSQHRKTALSCILVVAISLLSFGLGTLKNVPLSWVQVLFWGGTAVSLALIGIAVHAETSIVAPAHPASELYDQISQRCITVAFPLLTFGIITGALWANHAWGAYWSWDPKESMSLVTWLSYATYLHLRAQKDYRDDVMSVVAVIGLIVTLLTYLGFNFLGFGGLHSYGQIT